MTPSPTKRPDQTYVPRANGHGNGKREVQVIKVGEGRYGPCRDHGHSDLRRDGKGGGGTGGQEGASPPPAPDNTLSQVCPPLHDGLRLRGALLPRSACGAGVAAIQPSCI